MALWDYLMIPLDIAGDLLKSGYIYLIIGGLAILIIWLVTR
jgi:hypothetical protein